MILSFQTDTSGQTVQTQLRVCRLHLLDAIYSTIKPACSSLRVVTANFSRFLDFLQYLLDMTLLLLNPHLLSGPIHPYQLDESTASFRGVWCTFSFYFYFEYIFLLANSEDPDQTPHSVASDLGLHCLPMSQKGDT